MSAEWIHQDRRRWNPAQDINHIKENIDKIETDIEKIEAGHKQDMATIRVKIDSVHESLEDKITDLKKDLVGQVSTLRKDLVSQVEFTPFKLILYGLVGIILSAVVAALVAGVVVQRTP